MACRKPGRAAVLADLDIVVILLFAPGIGPQHRAAAGVVGNAAAVQLLVEHHHPRGAGPAQELVRRKENGVQALGRIGGVHVHGHVGGGGGEIDEAVAAVAVHDLGHLVVGGVDAGDVGAGGERADLQVAVLVALQDLFQVVEVGEAVAAAADDLDAAVALVPGGVVGVVLHVGDDDQRFFPAAARQLAAILVGDAQPQQALQLVDDRGHAEAGKEDGVVVAGVDVALDDLLGLAVGRRHVRAGHRRLGMGVGHERAQAVDDVFLDRAVKAAAGRPVGVEDALFTVGGGEFLVNADDLAAIWGKIFHAGHLSVRFMIFYAIRRRPSRAKQQLPNRGFGNECSKLRGYPITK